MAVYLHENDLNTKLDLRNGVAIDTETMGLDMNRDRLCVVQLSTGDGDAHIIQMKDPEYMAPRLSQILEDPEVLKIFHFARFDLKSIAMHLGVMPVNIYCTKVASKLVRTYSQHHSLKDLALEFLGVQMDKTVRHTDWGAETLTEDQLNYAASDVLYLHAIKERLEEMLEREGRVPMAEACFNILPLLVTIEMDHFNPEYIFSH